MLTALTEYKDIKRALRQFYAPLKTRRPIRHVIGFPGGSADCELFWHPDLNLWAVLEDYEDSNRSWNCFGTTDPNSTQKNLDIICEINFPHEGTNRRIAGIFARDADGRIYVVHSGKIGGNKGRFGRDLLKEHYRRSKQWVQVLWPDDQEVTEGVAITAVDSPELARRVCEFVCVVKDCKDRMVDAQPDDDDDGDDNISRPVVFRPEFSGVRATYTPPEAIESNNHHGPMVNALHEELRDLLAGSRFTPGNDRWRDLFIARGDQIHALFEVKPATTRTCIYTAIGQLFYHTAGCAPVPARILVSPEGLAAAHAKKLKHLGIEHLVCRVERHRHHFPGLPKLLARLNLSRS